jgi:hypothetical protein
MELADLTEKRHHDNVKRASETLTKHVFVSNPQIFEVTRIV